MGDNILEEILKLQGMFAELSEFEKQQAREDLDKLRGKTKKVTFKVQATVKSLRKAAAKLDEVWKGCKTAHAFGTTAGIVGGLLTIGGGVATIMTAGIASPLLIAGMSTGFVGAGTNLGTSIVEASLNSTEIEKAEKDLKETLDCINDVQNTVQLWLDRKEGARLFYIFCLAMKTTKMRDPVVKLLHQVILRHSSIPEVIKEAAKKITAGVGRHCTETAGKASVKAAGEAGAEAAGRAGAQAAGDLAESGAKAGTKAGSKLAGGLIIGVSIPFLVWDAIDLGFTIRDLVENKGSEAAIFLREKADELEKLYPQDTSEYRQQNRPMNRQQDRSVYRQQNRPMNRQQDRSVYRQQDGLVHRQQDTSLYSQPNRPLYRQQDTSVYKQSDRLGHRQQDTSTHRQQYSPVYRQQDASVYRKQYSPVQRQQGISVYRQPDRPMHRQHDTSAYSPVHRKQVYRQPDRPMHRQHDTSAYSPVHRKQVYRQQGTSVHRQPDRPVHRQLDRRVYTQAAQAHDEELKKLT